MSPWLFAKLLRGNLPHLIGMLIYGLLAIALALLCYKLFSKLIGLDTGLDASPQDRLSAVILAVGVVIGISILVAVTAYEPPQIPVPQSTAGSASSSGGCGSGSKAKAAAGSQTQQPAVQPAGKQAK